jgi:hypothetical protein
MSGRSEFLRGPKWRTQTSQSRRRLAATLTFAVIVVVGAVPMAVAMWVLAALGAPTWVASLPWVLPGAGALAWTLRRPAPAVATDDDDDSWPGYAIRWAMVGEDEPRPTAVRAVAATLFGAPIVWAIGVSLLGVLVGLG